MNKWVLPIAASLLLFSACKEPIDIPAPATTPPETTNTIEFTAHIGTNDTVVEFDSAADGYEFYRSTEFNCDLVNYGSCANGQMDLLNGTNIIDTALTLSQNAIYTLKSATEQSQGLHVSANRFSTSLRDQMVSFDNKLWVIGGDNDEREIWSSTDGVAWIQEVINVNFLPRKSHNIVVFNNKLWVIGGDNKNDVWSSIDGISWALEQAEAAFPKGFGDNIALFGGKIWLFGIEEVMGSFKTAAWSSSDGKLWVKEILNNAFFARTNYQLISFNNKLWVIAGKADRSLTLYSDVWSSADVKNWKQLRNEMTFSARYKSQAISFNNKLWLIGGLQRRAATAIWSSIDGVTWVQEADNAPFSIRLDHQVEVFNNKLWVIGGINYTSVGYTNDVWSSTDGVTWVQEIANGAFSARASHQVIAFKNKLWLIGGNADVSDNQAGLNDIWSSEDGITWVQEKVNAEFPARLGHQVEVFDGKLWLSGGFTTTPSPAVYSDVWSSDDGITWENKTNNAAFAFRRYHQMVAFNNKLWVIGGQSTDGNKNDVWSSTDGVLWASENNSAAFLKRHLHQAVNFNNKLWLIGGAGIQQTSDGESAHVYNDVWSSDDGKAWRKSYKGKVTFE